MRSHVTVNASGCAIDVQHIRRSGGAEHVGSKGRSVADRHHFARKRVVGSKVDGFVAQAVHSEENHAIGLDVGNAAAFALAQSHHLAALAQCGATQCGHNGHHVGVAVSVKLVGCSLGLQAVRTVERLRVSHRRYGIVSKTLVRARLVQIAASGLHELQ